MKLNGWQRLFTVTAALWSLLVIAVAATDWPTESSLSRTEIFRRLDVAVGRRIIGYKDALGTAGEAYTVRSLLIPDAKADGREPRRVLSANGTFYFFPADAADAEIVEVLTKDGAQALPGKPLFTDEPMPVNVQVSGHDLDVIPDAKDREASMNKVGSAFYKASREALVMSRARYAGWSLAAAVVPLAVIYAFGSAIAWVRRGFAVPS